MKKIKSIAQLRSEKTRLQEQEHQLEQAIREQWGDLKILLKPPHIAAGVLDCAIRNKTEDTLHSGSVLKNTLLYGITLLANKMLSKAGKKMSRVVNK